MKKIFRYIPLVFSWLTLSPLFYDLSKRWGIGSKPVRIILLVVSPLFLSIYFIIWCIKGDTDYGFMHSDNEKVSHTTKVEPVRENEKDGMPSHQETIIPHMRKWEGPVTFIYTFGEKQKYHAMYLDTIIPYVSAKDSVWIKVLNQIPIDVDSSDINLYYRMQLPEDIEIVARYIPSYYGILVASLYDHRTGKNYLYKKYIDEWNFTKNHILRTQYNGGEIDRDGDVHYFNYEWPEDPYVINNHAAFQLLDVDFDGKKELLVSNGSFDRGGCMLFIYRLKEGRIVPADDLPFSYVRYCFATDFDLDKKRISFSSSDVWSYACFFLTKTDKPISIQKKPAFKTSHAKGLWDDFDFSKNEVFVLDSIYERDEIYDPYSDYDMDSVWEYKRFGKEMKLVKSRKMKHE